MKIISALSKVINTNVFSEIKDLVTTYYPPSMSEQQKADLDIKVKALVDAKERQFHIDLNESMRLLDDRINQQEGTAQDLKSLPVIGRSILFLRGCQRPVWGFATLYFDYKWFFGGYDFDEQQQTGMILINFLVLGFLFGERTLKNLEPLILRAFKK